MNLQLLTNKILTEDKKARGDYLYLITCVWVMDKYPQKDDPQNEERINKTYEFLLGRPSPQTILRYKDEFFKHNQQFKYETESTVPLKRELSGEQTLDYGKKCLEEMREVLEK